MAEIDGELSVPSAGAGASSSLTPTAAGEKERTRERRERAMAEAALTLAEIGTSEGKHARATGSSLVCAYRVPSDCQRWC